MAMGLDHSGASLTTILLVFVCCAGLITVAGVRITRAAERLALVTGLGQLLTGAVFIGLTTSLSGLMTSVSAAAAGHASIAVSNALGGIAVQTMFLVVADMLYPHANLEHAAASEINLLQGVALMILLAIPLLGFAIPGITVFAVHPASWLLIVAYLGGLRLMRGAQRSPMWRPRTTEQTVHAPGNSDADHLGSTVAVCRDFAALGVLVAAAGWLLADAAIALVGRSGLSESLVGGVLTATTTSLPELVVAVAAVRRGALALALGDILGGNAFDVLFLSASDMAYREGSIFAAIGRQEIFWIALSMLMVGALVLGLLRREKHGIANIGFESVAVLVLYLGGILTLYLTGGLHGG